MYIRCLHGELRPKQLVPVEYGLAARHLHGTSVGTEPVTHGTDRISGLVVMSTNVLTCDVGTKISIAISLPIEHQATFLSVFRRSVALCAEEEAKFQRHIETRQTSLPIDPGTGNVVYSVLRPFDDVQNLQDARLAAVVNFKRRSRCEAAIVNRKHKRVEEPRVFLVKWNVEKNAVLVRRRHKLIAFWRILGVIPIATPNSSAP